MVPRKISVFRNAEGTSQLPTSWVYVGTLTYPHLRLMWLPSHTDILGLCRYLHIPISQVYVGTFTYLYLRFMQVPSHTYFQVYVGIFTYLHLRYMQVPSHTFIQVYVGIFTYLQLRFMVGTSQVYVGTFTYLHLNSAFIYLHFGQMQVPSQSVSGS